MRLSWTPDEGGKAWEWDGMLQIADANASLSTVCREVSLFVSREELAALRDFITAELEKGEANG